MPPFAPALVPAVVAVAPNWNGCIVTPAAPCGGAFVESAAVAADVTLPNEKMGACAMVVLVLTALLPLPNVNIDGLVVARLPDVRMAPKLKSGAAVVATRFAAPPLNVNGDAATLGAATGGAVCPNVKVEAAALPPIPERALPAAVEAGRGAPTVLLPNVKLGTVVPAALLLDDVTLNTKGLPVPLAAAATEMLDSGSAEAEAPFANPPNATVGATTAVLLVVGKAGFPKAKESLLTVFAAELVALNVGFKPEPPSVPSGFPMTTNDGAAAAPPLEFAVAVLAKVKREPAVVLGAVLVPLTAAAASVLPLARVKDSNAKEKAEEVGAAAEIPLLAPGAAGAGTEQAADAACSPGIGEE